MLFLHKPFGLLLFYTVLSSRSNFGRSKSIVYYFAVIKLNIQKKYFFFFFKFLDKHLKAVLVLFRVEIMWHFRMCIQIPSSITYRLFLSVVFKNIAFQNIQIYIDTLISTEIDKLVKK